MEKKFVPLAACKLVKTQMDELRPESPSPEFKRASALLQDLIQYFDDAADPSSTMEIAEALLLEDKGILALEVAEATEVRKILEEKEFGFLCQLHSNETIYRALVQSRGYVELTPEARTLKAKAVEQGAARYLVEEAGLDWPDPNDSWSSWVNEHSKDPGTPDS